MTRLCAGLMAILLQAGCALQRQAETAPAPVVAHHQHLLSPEAARVWSTEVSNAIEVPDSVARLIRALEQGFGDRAALATYYTEDALLLISEDPEWIRGRSNVVDNHVRAFRQSYRFTPVAYDATGPTARLAVYLTRDHKGSPRHFAHALLALKQDSEGRWQISSETLVPAAPVVLEPQPADTLIAQLDAAGIQRAVVLSVGYLYGDPRRRLGDEHVRDEYARVRTENDWTAQEVARFPQRLVGFCGFNPLRPYALEEIDRCVEQLHLRGLKLHMGNSGVDFRDPAHVARLREIFSAANARRLPVVIHLRTRNSAYGRLDAEIFLNEVLPAAPDSVVQIAHLAGAGPGYPAHADEAMGVFAAAVAARDPRTRNLYFDVTTNVTTATSEANAKLIVSRIRQVGVERVLFGTDLSTGLPGGNPPVRPQWAVFRAMLPLTDQEVRAIAANIAPYLR